MAVRYRTGNKTTLVLASPLTGAFVADIVSIDLGSQDMGKRDVSVLSDEDFKRYDPEDLAEPNEITVRVFYKSTNAIPPAGKNIGTATITLPGGGILAGKAFYTSVGFPTAENNSTMEAEYKLQMTGETLAFTAGT
jgi:hypothetical protein